MGTARAQYVVDAEGKKKGVIIPVAQYRRLLEDLHDLAVVAERRKEEPVSLEEMKRRLRRMRSFNIPSTSPV
jgi:hypothetical protein